MKSMITLLALTFSLAAFAQDSVDLVLSSITTYHKASEQVFNDWKFAKVKFQRRYYDEMMRDSSFTLNCYSTADKGVQLVVGQGQMAVFHKQGSRGERGGCNSSQCQNSNFEDFVRVENDAYNSVFNNSLRITFQYSLSSVASYEKERLLSSNTYSSFPEFYMPTVEEIPYVTIYSPKAHQGNPQITESFHCYLWAGKAPNKYRVEP